MTAILCLIYRIQAARALNQLERLDAALTIAADRGDKIVASFILDDIGAISRRLTMILNKWDEATGVRP